MAVEQIDHWERLGRLLMARRVQVDPRFRNRRTFVEENHLDYKVVSDIETARRRNFTRPTLALLEGAYRLADGSIERTAEGGELEGTANIGLSAQLSARSTLTAAAEVESEWPVPPDHPPPDLPRLMTAGYAGFSEAERGILWLRGATPDERLHLVYAFRAVHEATLAAQAEEEEAAPVREFKRDR